MSMRTFYFVNVGRRQPSKFKDSFDCQNGSLYCYEMIGKQSYVQGIGQDFLCTALFFRLAMQKNAFDLKLLTLYHIRIEILTYVKSILEKILCPFESHDPF